jgi:outer membrane receptor protein involved in Fe transport
LHRSVTLFADYGRGYRSPEARAITAAPPKSVEDKRLSLYQGGAPEITVVDTVEAGIETTPFSWLSGSLFAFASFLEREMVFDHVSNLNVAMDGTRRLGVTAQLLLTPLPWLTLGGDATWTDARFNHSKNPVPGVPRWMGSAHIHTGKPLGPSGRLALDWCGTRPLAHGAQTVGYAKLDAQAGWRFERVAVAVLVENVLNQKIMEGVYHFASWFDETEQRSLIPTIHYAAGAPITARFVATVYL